MERLGVGEGPGDSGGGLGGMGLGRCELEGGHERGAGCEGEECEGCGAHGAAPGWRLIGLYGGGLGDDAVGSLPKMGRMNFSVVGVCVVGCLLTAVGGCADRVRAARQNTLAVRAPVTSIEVNPDIAVVVYAYEDRNTADIVFSSWTVAELRAFAETGALRPGSMLHVHYFLTPAAGRTPIDFTAQNATIRYLVLPSDRGEVAGLYSGGGFVLPSGAPGEMRFYGSMREATIRPIAVSDGFRDVLGPAEVSASIVARRDEATTGALLRWMREMERTRIAGR